MSLIALAPIEQGTPEWHQARLGKATASRIADIIATTKSGYTTGRANYAADLITERLTGVPASTYENEAMRWGKDNEPNARRAYQFLHGEVQQVGFIDHPDIPHSGCSPDGLVGDDGLVEIKCPFKTAVHINTLLKREVPSEYLTQMQWQMAVTGRKWNDFCTFDPRLPESMNMLVLRVQRDDMVIGRLEREVKLFLGEINETLNKLKARYGE